MTSSFNSALLATDGIQVMEGDEMSVDGPSRREERGSFGDPGATSTVGPDVGGGGGDMSVVLSELNIKGDGDEPRGVAGVRTNAEMAGTTNSAVQEVQKYDTTSEQYQPGHSQGSHNRGRYVAGLGDGKRLIVMDAISYLNAVENKLKDQRGMYHRFLEIMKDFRDEQIDTPDVIQRVSQLFHGYPALIQGFNDFLPVESRIECPSDPQDEGVKTPTGTTTQSTNEVAGHGHTRQDAGSGYDANSEHGAHSLRSGPVEGFNTRLGGSDKTDSGIVHGST